MFLSPVHCHLLFSPADKTSPSHVFTPSHKKAFSNSLLFCVQSISGDFLNFDCTTCKLTDVGFRLFFSFYLSLRHIYHSQVCSLSLFQFFGSSIIIRRRAKERKRERLTRSIFSPLSLSLERSPRFGFKYF